MFKLILQDYSSGIAKWKRGKVWGTGRKALPCPLLSATFPGVRGWGCSWGPGSPWGDGMLWKYIVVIM